MNERFVDTNVFLCLLTADDPANCCFFGAYTAPYSEILPSCIIAPTDLQPRDWGQSWPMKRTLQILNELESAGLLRRYAIGGAMGATFYVEPLLTFDLDVFVVLPGSGEKLLSPLRFIRTSGFGATLKMGST
jgi:hypothetical protein